MENNQVQPHHTSDKMKAPAEPAPVPPDRHESALIVTGGNVPAREKAVLIGIQRRETPEGEYQWSEFGELLRTVGGVAAGNVRQLRPEPDPALFLGSGKAEYLAELVRETRADLVIAQQELTPVQIRNLEDQTGVRVIDRTDLILAIFAGRARTKEGKLQVELAQLNYLLPRLSRSGHDYSRLGGGIGTRGPGETKLETDRRRVRHRIAEIRRELEAVAQHRSIQRHRREKAEVPSVALVGYTNAGKSTLFNRCAAPGPGTAVAAVAADRLFETLDPLSRQLLLPNRREVVLLDTVGFISDLPHQLVAAFRATLEETVRATLLLHVLDCSSPYLNLQYGAVQEVLGELGITAKEHLTVLNKCDRIDNEYTLTRLAKEWGAIPVSARYGRGIDELLFAIQQRLFNRVTKCRLLVPFAEAALVDWLHRNGRVVAENFNEQGVRLEVELETAFLAKLEKFVLPEDEEP